MPTLKTRLLRSGCLVLKISDANGAGNVRVQGDHAGIFSGVFQAAAKAHARGVHVHFHGVAGVPPIFERILGDTVFGFVSDFSERWWQRASARLDASQRKIRSEEFGQGLLKLFFFGRSAVPTGFVFHE